MVGTARHRIDRDGSGDITIEDILAFLKEAGGLWILRDRQIVAP